MFSLQSYLKSLKKKQQEMVKKHQQDLGIPETTEKAELAEEPKTDSEDSDLASLDDLPAAPPAATVTAGSEVASLSSTPSGTPMQCRSPSAHHEDDAPVTVASSSSVAALALRLDDVHDERSNSPFRTSDGDDNLDKRKRKVTFFSIFTMLRF